MVAGEQCFPISEISSYMQRWTIRARITSKAPMRTFARGNNTGKVFHVHLLDVYGGEIRATFFNEAAEKHFNLLQMGKCYSFSRGGVKIADQRFNPCGHRYEIVFDKLAEIKEEEDDDNIEVVKFSLTDLRAVQSKALPCTVDLCGVLTSVGPMVSFSSRDGKELVKRELTIADDTATSMNVTVWGDRAKQEDQTFEGNPVVGLKGVMIKEWNGGRSGSLSEGGNMVFKPKLPDAARVQQWWTGGGKTQSLTALSVTGGGGASNQRLAGAKTVDLSEMRRLSEQVMHQPELFSTVCRLCIVQMQKRGEPQPLTYNACQEPKEGKGLPCNRRVDSSGFCASCNRAGKSAARFNLRCRFSDFGDNAWLTTFHEAAQQVVGMTAEQAHAMETGEGGREELEATIAAKYFRQPMRLTLRAKLDTYNGEARTNITCIDARPVPRGERGRAMLHEIQERLNAGASLDLA